MKLSKEEQKAILKMREKDEQAKPKKTAEAKDNIYSHFDHDFVSDAEEWFFNPSEREQCIKNFAASFDLAVKKGDSFSCFINDDGKEEWYDDVNYGFEMMTAEWAKKYLTNFRSLKK